MRGILLERSLKLEIPEKVRRNAALTGETALAWLGHLPQQIVELERRWAIKVEQPAQCGSEAFVAAARTSADWYEHFSEHMKLDLMDFGYSYITRSGRIDDARLRAMSPQFMARYEAAKSGSRS